MPPCMSLKCSRYRRASCPFTSFKRSIFPSLHLPAAEVTVAFVSIPGSCPPFECVHAGVTPRKLVDFFKCSLWHEARECIKSRERMSGTKQSWWWKKVSKWNSFIRSPTFSGWQERAWSRAGKERPCHLWLHGQSSGPQPQVWEVERAGETFKRTWFSLDSDSHMQHFLGWKNKIRLITTPSRAYLSVNGEK